MKKHTFYSDPGHGWLAVPRQELIDLGILHKITSYSYQRQGMVYLEEDCDLSTYAAAIDATGQEFKCKSAPQANGYSRIRNYPGFRLTLEEKIESAIKRAEEYKK